MDSAAAAGAQTPCAEADRDIAHAQIEGIRRAYEQIGLDPRRDPLFVSQSLSLGSLVAWSAEPTGAPLQHRVALVVGNARYKNVPALATTEKDATDFANALRQSNFASVALKLNLNEADFEAAVRAFRTEAQTADVALFYYAGHGLHIGGENYLIPTDAALKHADDIEFEAVALSAVLKVAEEAKQLSLAIIDASRRSPFLPSMKQEGASRAFDAGLGGLEPTGRSTVTLFSAKEGQYSVQEAGPNSLFTRVLTEEVATSAAELQLLMGRVRDRVVAESEGRQEPAAYGSLGGKSFYFRPPAGAPSTAPVSESQIEDQLWAGARGATTPEEIDPYLNRFPNGRFVREARERQNALLRVLIDTPDKLSFVGYSPRQVGAAFADDVWLVRHALAVIDREVVKESWDPDSLRGHYLELVDADINGPRMLQGSVIRSLQHRLKDAADRFAATRDAVMQFDVGRATDALIYALAAYGRVDEAGQIAQQYGLQPGDAGHGLAELVKRKEDVFVSSLLAQERFFLETSPVVRSLLAQGRIGDARRFWRLHDPKLREDQRRYAFLQTQGAYLGIAGVFDRSRIRPLMDRVRESAREVGRATRDSGDSKYLDHQAMVVNAAAADAAGLLALTDPAFAYQFAKSAYQPNSFDAAKLAERYVPNWEFEIQDSLSLLEPEPQVVSVATKFVSFAKEAYFRKTLTRLLAEGRFGAAHAFAKHHAGAFGAIEQFEENLIWAAEIAATGKAPAGFTARFANAASNKCNPHGGLGFLMLQDFAAMTALMEGCQDSGSYSRMLFAHINRRIHKTR